MQTVYRGYMIRQAINGEWFIEKDGYHIGWARSVDEAKGIIDLILG